MKYKCENVYLCVFVSEIIICKENSRLKVVLFRELRVGSGLGKQTQSKVSFWENKYWVCLDFNKNNQSVFANY